MPSQGRVSERGGSGMQESACEPSAFAATSSSQPGLALLDPSLPEEEEGNRRPGGASLCGSETIAAGRARSRAAQVPGSAGAAAR